MKKSLQLNLRAGERLYINGAVLKVDRKVSIELLNEATFLLEGHVMLPERAVTPFRQLYYMLQTVLIDPAAAGDVLPLYEHNRVSLLAAVSSREIRQGLELVGELTNAGRIFAALKALRGLFETEDAILARPPLAHEPPGSMAEGSIVHADSKH